MFLCTASAVADTKDIGDVDEELARRHFAAGLQNYSAHHYAEAIREFEAARKLKPLPAFDYNIGRCYDLSEKWKEAADAYERYLAASPNAVDAVTLRVRIKTLRERAKAVAPPVELPPPEVAPPPSPAPQPELEAIPINDHDAEKRRRPLVKKPWFWATIGGVVVVAGVAVGLGVGLAGNHDPSATYGHVFGN